MPKTNATQPVKKRDRIGIILYLVYFVMLLGAVLLTVRIIGIQLFFRPEPEIAAKLTPKVTERSIEPERGRILDCNGRLLAISCPEYQFYMDCTVRKDTNTPEEEKKWRDEARELSKGLAKEFPEMTADQFYRLIMTNRNDENKPGRKYVRIGHPVDRTAYNRILSLPLFRKGRYYSGVQCEQENVREYPYDELARRTIGFVRNNKSPVRNTHIGLEGKFDYDANYIYVYASFDVTARADINVDSHRFDFYLDVDADTSTGNLDMGDRLGVEYIIQANFFNDEEGSFSVMDGTWETPDNAADLAQYILIGDKNVEGDIASIEFKVSRADFGITGTKVGIGLKIENNDWTDFDALLDKDGNQGIVLDFAK